jgi:hypothetical protein
MNFMISEALPVLCGTSLTIKFMKRQIRAAILIASFVTGLSAYADPVLIISDGVTSSGAITLTGGSGTYVNPFFDSSWSVVVTTGASKPVFGTATSPNMELAIQATSLGSVNPLTVILSDNNFGPTSGNGNATAQIIGQAFGGTGDVVTFNTYADTNNALAGLTTLLTASGSLAPSLYTSSQTTSLNLAAPYSLTAVVEIAGGQAVSYSLDANFQATNAAPPPCTCANPVLLGTASTMSVLELGAKKVTLSGPSGIAGDVGIGPNGVFESSGSTVVTGIITLDTGATYHPSGTATNGGVVHASLSTQIADALTAAANAAAQPCTFTFPTINATKTITSTGPTNVVCINNLALGGGAVLTLSGSASDIFILNITGNLSMGGASVIKVAGGLVPNNVLINVIGTGPGINVGGGSTINGALLAVSRDLVLSAGVVNGVVISGGNMNITSGEQIRCPCTH